MALEKYIVRSIAAVAAAAVAGPALAADLAVKAPQPVAAFAPSDIHGFFDVSFGGDYVTPRGVHVTGTGLTTQIATGLSADVYKNKTASSTKYRCMAVSGVAGCGTIATPCAASNAGVFSTGLTATGPVTWIPSNFGHWSVRGGFQYYHLMNDSLLLAQTLIGTASSYTTAKRDIAIGFAGLSFNF